MNTIVDQNQLQAEEFYTQLSKEFQELQSRKQKHQNQLKMYEKLQNEVQRDSDLVQQLEHANGLLDKIFEYLDQQEIISQTNHQLSQSMRDLGQSVEDCIVAEQEFETRATQDPKEVMPYTRSNLYPTARSARPIKTPNIIPNNRILESRQSDLTQGKTIH